MKKKFFYFTVTMLVAITIAFCSCSPKMGCSTPANDYWRLRGIDKE